MPSRRSTSWGEKHATEMARDAVRDAVRDVVRGMVRAMARERVARGRAEPSREPEATSWGEKQAAEMHFTLPLCPFRDCAPTAMAARR